MSEVDRQGMGMLSSVMRALKHKQAAQAMRGQGTSWRSSVAAVGSAIGMAVGPVVQAVAGAASEPDGHATDPEDGVRGRHFRPISGFGPLF